MMQTKLNMKKGDKVVIIAGRSKGHQGTILKAIPSESKLIVSGANMIKRHTKASQANPDGGIVERESAIHSSNVMHVDPKTGKPTRVGMKVQDGKKVRFAKKSGELIERE